MKKYIGTKIVLAENEMKDGVEGMKVVYSDGYTSWSPKDIFNASYREISVNEVKTLTNK